MTRYLNPAASGLRKSLKEVLAAKGLMSNMHTRSILGAMQMRREAGEKP